MRYKTSKEIPVVSHNDPIHDYHFIIKEISQTIKAEFKYLGKNTEK